MDKVDYEVAIVGAGFCGTMVAVTLTRRAPSVAIALIERTETAGRGLAYGTPDMTHLLNVPARGMGAFADQPGDFYAWLTQLQEFSAARPTDFAPRAVYGRYLDGLLRQACDGGAVTLVQGAVTDISRLPQGVFVVRTADGGVFTALRVVLALGNFPPDEGRDNPYDPATWRRLAEPGDVLIVGAGLTSLDLVVTLARTKREGHIHVLSRHGLLPREHADTVVPVAYALDWQMPYPATALGLLRALRRSVAAAPGVPWQSVVDALRPISQILWQDLPLAEQERFLQHLRPYWDVHRHRCAPQIMDAWRALEKQGRISLHCGPIVGQVRTPDGWNVTWRPRGGQATRSFGVRQIVRCTGPQRDMTKLDDALVCKMLASGLVTPDRLRLGIETDGGYQAVDATGKPVAGLYALGSLLRGLLHESIAVPELRQQAAEVAALLAG